MAIIVESSQISFAGELSDSSMNYKHMTLNEAIEYMENMEYCEEGNNIFENNAACICNESEAELSMIRNKFNSFINESDDITETEEEKLKAIEEKRSSMVKSFSSRIRDNINSIKRISAKANDEAINMAIEDRKTFKNFIPALRDKNNLEGFIGIKDFCFPGEKYAACVDSIINSTDAVVSLHKKYMGYLAQASTIDSIKNYYKLFCNQITSEIDDKIDERCSKCIKKADRWKPTLKDISMMNKFINNPSAITCSIADGCKHATSNLAKVGNNAVFIFKRVSAESDIDIVRMNYMYRCTSIANRKIASMFYNFKDFTIREIAAYRKSIMITGKYANDKKNKKERSVKEWALIENTMSTTSDLYVFEKLSL